MRMSPGTFAALILALAVLLFAGYSYVVSSDIKDHAAATGTSTKPREPGSIQDLPATNKPKPPLVDTNVPPPAPQNK
jgi:hypothetical protein